MIIPAPCDADWDSMTGNERVRFCEHCSLHVTDLSSMTRKDALELVARSEGRLCVRFIPTPTGGLLTRTMPEKLYRIRRRVSRVAAGAFTATISISSAMAQSRPASKADPLDQAVPVLQQETQEQIIIDEFGGRVSGIVKNQDGMVISNAVVVLVDRETGEERSVTASTLGQYSFDALPQGEYLLWARASGFRTKGAITVELPANSGVNAALEMEERTFMQLSVMGAMALVAVREDPLFTAVQDNDIAKVQELVRADARLNLADRRYGMSILTEAVQKGNHGVISTLLAFGADVNVRNGAGRTALMYLSETTTPEVLRDLLSVGAKLNARDDSGANSFTIAAASASPRVLKDMIEAGAQINARDSTGENCLFGAARTNSSEVITLLIEAGVDLDVRNEDGETALMAMASNGSYETFKILIARGADQNLVSEDRRTLLMLAAFNDDPRLVRFLLDAGADLNAQDSWGKTALMFAAQTGRVDNLSMLCLAGADLDKQDIAGDTALMDAVQADNLECVEVLLKAGADTTKKNDKGMTALALARGDHSEISDLLRSRGAP
jgi:ankyrin repeat protein